MAINRATDLSNASNDLLLASVITERVATVMRPLVTVKTIPQGRNQITANTFGTVSISALTDGVDLAAPSSFTPTQFTLTASERGAMVVITDKARRETVGNVESDAGQELGNALAEDFDTQLFGQFDSFSTNALGSASTEISLVYALSGYSLLYGNSTQPVPATGKISYVGHTFTLLNSRACYLCQELQTFLRAYREQPSKQAMVEVNTRSAYCSTWVSTIPRN